MKSCEDNVRSLECDDGVEAALLLGDDVVAACRLGCDGEYSRINAEPLATWA
jgi:hypothetical protein